MGKAFRICSVQELSRALEKKEECQIIDVREPVEYASEHIEGSVLLPLSKLGEEPAWFPLLPGRRAP